jgi:hypothetical protein
MSRPKKARIPIPSSQSALEAQRKSSDNVSVAQTMAHSESEIPMDLEQEVGVKNAISAPQLPQKRGVGARIRSKIPQEQEQDESDNITVAPQILQPMKNARPRLVLKLPREFNHVVLQNETACDNFLSKINDAHVDLRDLKTLEVHLDASKLNAYTEHRFALALNKLHPHRDGTNSHDVQTTRIVVKGNLLFTRYNYHLVSPTLSNLVGDKFKKLSEGKLSEQEKKALPHKINSTERLLAAALLGIRGVKQVSIEGKGTMEADFAATLKATLIQSTGTDILEASDEESRFSTHRMNKPGTISSDAYPVKGQNAYPTVSGDFEYDFSRLPTKKRFLLNEKTELIGHFKDMDDQDAQAAAVVKQQGPGGRKLMPTFQVGPIVKSSSRTRRTMATQAVDVEDFSGKNEDEQDGFGLMEMVRINKKKARPGDIDSATLNSEVMPVVLTAKEEAVEFGWRV